MKAVIIMWMLVPKFHSLEIIFKLPGNLCVLSTGKVYTSFSLLSVFNLASGMWWLMKDIIFSGSHVSFLYKLMFKRKDNSFVFSPGLSQKESFYWISSFWVLLYSALGNKQSEQIVLLLLLIIMLSVWKTFWSIQRRCINSEQLQIHKYIMEFKL